MKQVQSSKKCLVKCKVLTLLLVFTMVVSVLGVEANATWYSAGQAQPVNDNQTSNQTPVLTAHDPNDFTDIKGNWAEHALANAITYGLIEGKEPGKACPDDFITRAEMAALMTRGFEATKTAGVVVFVDMKPDAWHFNYVSRAVQMGVLSGNGNAMNPNGHITRQEAAVVFARAFNLYSYKKSTDGFTDANSVASYAQEAMEACVGAGIMGVGGSLNPTGDLTRAEFASMMYGIVQTYINSAVPYTGGSSITGSAMVTVPNVSITNTSISNNLYLGDGVENGTITLDGVQVNGTVYMRGGSKLNLVNGTHVGSVVVYNPSYAVVVETDASSSAGSTIVDTAISAITLTGNVGDVKMNTAKAVLALKNAKVGKLLAYVTLPTITIDKDSTVDSLDVPERAIGAKVTVDGKVKEILVDAESGEFTTSTSANITNLDMNGISGTMKLDGKLKTVVIGENAEDNEISIEGGAKIDTVNLRANGENDISVASGADVGTFSVNEPKAKMNLTLSLEKFLVDSGAKAAKITFEDGTNIDILEVKADDVDILVKRGASIKDFVVTGFNVHIEVEEGANVDTMEVFGRDVLVKGTGSVNTVELKNGGNNATIETPNTTVKNNSNTDAKVGNAVVKPGEEGKTDNDGKTETTTKDEDKNDDKAGDKESIFGMAFAGSAMSNDLSATGTYTVGDFCANIAYDYTGRIITGTVNQVRNFPLFAGTSSDTGYYIPMVLDTNVVTDDFTLRILDKTYTKNDVSKGQVYSGRLLFFLPLNPNTGSNTNGQKTITIYYDADGTKTVYKETTAVVTYTQVKFVGSDSETLARTAYIQGAPGIGTNNAIEVTNVSAISDGTYNVLTSGADIASVANPAGTMGHWAGVRFVGPTDASTAEYSVTTNGTTRKYTANATGVHVNGANQLYTAFDHYENLANVKQAVVTIEWKTGTGICIGNPETYIVDFSQVTLVGVSGGGGDDPVVTDPNAIATTFSIGELADAEVRRASNANHGLSDFVQGYRIVNTNNTSAMIAGTYYNVSGEQIISADGYYLPLSITVDGLRGNARVMLNGTKLYQFTTENTGVQTVNMIIPLGALGAQITNFNLVLEDAGGNSATYTSITKAVDASQAAGYQAETGMLISKAASTFSAGGMNMSQLVASGYDVVTAGTGANILGTYKQTKLVGGDARAWYAPIRVANQLTKLGNGWKIKVTGGENISYTSDVFPDSQTHADFYIPLGAGVGADGADVKFDSVTVEILDGASSITRSSAIVSTTSATLSGFDATGNTRKNSAGIYAVTDDVSIDAVKVSDMVDGNVSLKTTGNRIEVSGKLKKVTANGETGWYAPLSIKITQPVAANWKVIIFSDGARKEITDGLTNSVTELKLRLPMATSSEGKDTKVMSTTVMVVDTSTQDPVTLGSYEVVLASGIQVTDALLGFTD